MAQLGITIFKRPMRAREWHSLTIEYIPGVSTGRIILCVAAGKTAGIAAWRIPRRIPWEDFFMLRMIAC